MKQNIRDKYKLTEQESDNIFKQIEQEVFGEIPTSDKPISIIVGGQSGAGKGAVISFSKNELESDGKKPIIITTDEYKPYHPNSKEIAKRYPTEYVEIVEQYAGAWTDKVLRKAIDDKYDFIFEGTLKNNRILEKIKEMKEKGFLIKTRVLAVSKLESLISIHERYQQQIDTIGWGRLISIKQHNMAYSGIPSVIDEIEKSGFCDVEVFIRGKELNKPQMVYSSCQNSQSYPTARIALEHYRKTQGYITKVSAEDRINRLKQKFIERNATNEEMEQLCELEQEFINYR